MLRLKLKIVCFYFQNKHLVATAAAVLSKSLILLLVQCLLPLCVGVSCLVLALKYTVKSRKFELPIFQNTPLFKKEKSDTMDSEKMAYL